MLITIVIIINAISVVLYVQERVFLFASYNYIIFLRILFKSINNIREDDKRKICGRLTCMKLDYMYASFIILLKMAINDEV